MMLVSILLGIKCHGNRRVLRLGHLPDITSAIVTQAPWARAGPSLSADPKPAESSMLSHDIAATLSGSAQPPVPSVHLKGDLDRADMPSHIAGGSVSPGEKTDVCLC